MPRANLKDQIAVAALDVLHRRGFNATGVQDITASAGVPKGSFYNHFASKEAIGIEALERYWLSGLPLLEALADDSQPPLKRLRTYFGYLRNLADERSYNAGCLIGNFATEMADSSPAIRAELARLFAAWTTAFEVCVAAGQADGSLRKDLKPSVVAAFLLNSWEGAVLRAKVDKNSAAFEAFETVAFDLLER